MGRKEWWKEWGLEPHDIEFSVGDIVKVRDFPLNSKVPRLPTGAVKVVEPSSDPEAHSQVLKFNGGDAGNGYWYEKVKP